MSAVSASRHLVELQGLWRRARAAVTKPGPLTLRKNGMNKFKPFIITAVIAIVAVAIVSRISALKSLVFNS
jgi:hypothetical protein